jgi:hypothetical protein
LILASACLRAYAQEPIDNDTWKQRCTTLAASADAIDKGSAPAALLLTTRGIAGSKFAAIAHERGNAGQHYIACTLYYTAAIAEYQGNDGKVDPAKAHGDAAQGAIELKLATGQVLTFKEKVDPDQWQNHAGGHRRSVRRIRQQRAARGLPAAAAAVR